ncbi:MAG: M20/M25/M40 family metallo-hydrolase [Thermoleophilaceae bacterium]
MSVSGAHTPQVGTGERERLVEDFVRLCEIESPSLHERPMADAVAAECNVLGLEVTEDASARATGSDAGNLIARLPGPAGAPTILLCAHLDTVPLDGPVEVRREGGVLSNRHRAILGADNKAAVAVILAALRHHVQRGQAPVGLELAFTTAEEPGLLGAKELDRHALRSGFGFVLDHASPIGELITAAPTYYRLLARFTGAAAHAGIRPEDGRNAIVAAGRAVAAMSLGRLDDRTTANAGTIEGGTARNVVAELCQVELEARSLDDERAGQAIAEMVDRCSDAAGETECDVDTTVEQLCRAFKLARSAPPVRVAAAALEDLGIDPVYRSSGGGSDANALIANGLPVLNVANGTQRNHQPDESVTVQALETMLDVTLRIIERSAEA